MAEEKIKLPRSSFDELCKIISVYGQFDKPATLTELSKTAALSKESISANNKFLVGIGIIEGGQKKQATLKGINLAKAIEHQMPEEQRRHWRDIVAGSDFLSRLVTAVRIRKGMDEETLRSHIAYSAGEPNKGYVMTGARAVIDLLRAAEFVLEEDGKLTAVDVRTIDASEEPRTDDNVRQPSTSTFVSHIKAQGEADQFRTTMQRRPAAIQLRVNVNLQCTPDDLEGLGEKLLRIIEEVSKESSQEMDTGLDQGDD